MTKLLIVMFLAVSFVIMEHFKWRSKNSESMPKNFNIQEIASFVGILVWAWWFSVEWFRPPATISGHWGQVLLSVVAAAMFAIAAMMAVLAMPKRWSALGAELIMLFVAMASCLVSIPVS